MIKHNKLASLCGHEAPLGSVASQAPVSLAVLGSGSVGSIELLQKKIFFLPRLSSFSGVKSLISMDSQCLTEILPWLVLIFAKVLILLLGLRREGLLGTFSAPETPCYRTGG